MSSRTLYKRAVNKVTPMATVLKHAQFPFHRSD